MGLLARAQEASGGVFPVRDWRSVVCGGPSERVRAAGGSGGPEEVVLVVVVGWALLRFWAVLGLIFGKDWEIKYQCFLQDINNEQMWGDEKEKPWFHQLIIRTYRSSWQDN